jgi:large subunit ribosomal protein L6
MSRIGKKEIEIDENVKVSLTGKNVLISGPNGQEQIKLPDVLTAKINDSKLIVDRINDKKETKSLHGLFRQLLANATKGVTENYQKQLEIKGVGYRAIQDGEKLVLSLGYSHPVEIIPPEGIKFTIAKNIITIEGLNKQKVGQMAAHLRSLRPPDPYKGKGIRYLGENIKLKPGKTAKATGE